MKSSVLVISIPGLRLLDVRRISNNAVEIRCPGCSATKIFDAGQPGIKFEGFYHESDDCSVLARITRGRHGHGQDTP
jgi:hypothetical protein